MGLKQNPRLIVAAAFVALAYSNAALLSSFGDNYVVPGEPLATDGIRVTALGTGVPSLTKDQFCTSYLVQLGNGESFIFDLGDGAFINLQQTGIHWGQTKVFLSHLHSDHTADLVQLLALGLNHGREGQLHIWGPDGPTKGSGTAAMVEGLNQFLGWDRMARARVALSTAELQAERPPIDYDRAQARAWKDNVAVAHEFDHSVERQLVYQSSSGVRILATPVDHYFTPGPVALRLEWRNISFTYSGDTAPTRTLLDLAAGSDVLLHEALGSVDYEAMEKLHDMARNIIASHTTPQQAGEILDRIRPRMGIITHVDINDFSLPLVSAQLASAYRGRAAVAQDLDVWDITPQRVTYRKMIIPTNSWGDTFRTPLQPPFA